MSLFGCPLPLSHFQRGDLRPHACWDCRFESFYGHGCLSLASDVGWQSISCGTMSVCPACHSPKESEGVWWVWVWSWSLDNEKVLAQYWLSCHEKTNYNKIKSYSFFTSEWFIVYRWLILFDVSNSMSWLCGTNLQSNLWWTSVVNMEDVVREKVFVLYIKM